MNTARSRRASLASVCCAALAALTLVLPQPELELETDFSARHHCSFWATR